MVAKTICQLRSDGLLKVGARFKCRFSPYDTFTVGRVYEVVKAREGSIYGTHLTSDSVPQASSVSTFVPADIWDAGPVPTQDEAILAVASGYPDDNPKTAVGLTKPSLSAVPPIAMFHLGKAMLDGMRKYGKMNYREKKVSSSVYYDAALRHLMSWYDGEQLASDSGVHHLGHAMACMAILLDAEAMGQLNDDRPIPGPLPAFLAANTNSAAASH